MTRIMLLVTVALVMAAMMLAMALPVFAVGRGTGQCAQSIAQEEIELRGTKGEAIRTFCLGRL
jgi:Tfp pilus assembly protein FimT